MGGDVAFGDFMIETPRLQLVCCNKRILETLFKGDEAIARLLNVNIPVNWTEFGTPAFRYVYNKIRHTPGHIKWWTYLPVLKKTKTLLGSCGFKGEPRDGMVEIGYEVAQAYRGLGLATEIAKALVTEAFKRSSVQYVQAHTLANENASCSVLRKCGMTKVAEITDPSDGAIWRWEIRRVNGHSTITNAEPPFTQ